ncbi:PfkB family carbohydrate kinase (plasmid) [Rhizobium sp. CB3060]|uniref:PfkB family carbohydrate kinase n=1 Tax=Rhizobium sp. CB3060 TaxID=3138255 RepID=UPI0021A6355E|nr:PfkB family carbohydrate kinase [Rhizobium tropici]UWU25946.1 PfkB family carbohydrate kinase [Rhizobium tropici]
MLDRLYQDGRFSDESLGGSCGNVLVSLAMLHRAVAPVLRLGLDLEGDRLITEFCEAGAIVSHIHRSPNLRSPVLAEKLDTASGVHRFSFKCPETDADLPRYEPIGEPELTEALPLLEECAIFYADRLSESILEAMRTARAGGAIVFFEPSEIGDSTLFEHALALATIVKYSSDRLDDELEEMAANCIKIVTHGSSGLEVRDGSSKIWCNAINASEVRDTCGSGDMVSVGIIDWLLTEELSLGELNGQELIAGVVAGQRLAAANCAYAGARGLFKHRGASYIRSLLHAE